MALFLAACGGEAEGPDEINLAELFGEADAGDAPVVVIDVGQFDSTIPDADADADAPVEVVEPDVPDVVVTTNDVGEACGVGVASCSPGLTCLEDPGWPGGMCARPGCDPAVGCGERQVCVPLGEENVCLASCGVRRDCRQGYRCGVRGPEVRACLPVTDVLGAADGSRCTLDSDCAGGTCLTTPDYPGGYCTTLHCVVREDCSSINTVSFCDSLGSDPSMCARSCGGDGDGDCRLDYRCDFTGGVSTGQCVPRVELPVAPASQGENPLPVNCGVVVEDDVGTITFEIPVGTRSFSVASYAIDGRAIAPISLTDPNGLLVELDGLYDSNNPVYSQVFGGSSSVQPPGEYVLRIATESTELCSLILPESEVGSILDLNIYLLGARDVQWNTAGQSEPLQLLVEHVRETFAGAGIDLRSVTFPEVPNGVREFVASDIQGLNLARYASAAFDSQDEALSIDVFIPAAITHGFDAVGLRPGPVGLHGISGAGVVVTGEFLVDGQGPNEPGGSPGWQWTAQILTREIGQYLGLRKTNIFGTVMDIDTRWWRDDWTLFETETMASSPLTKSAPFGNIP